MISYHLYNHQIHNLCPNNFFLLNNCSPSQRLTILITYFSKIKEIDFVTTFCVSCQKNISNILKKNVFCNTSMYTATLLGMPQHL